MSDARSALAKVLTSSVSSRVLVRRLRSSAIAKSCYGSTLTPETRGCSGDGGAWADPEPVPPSSLPTEPEWEEPVQRVAMTTFRVVPSKPTGAEPAPDVPDQIEVEGVPSIEGSLDPQTDGESQVEEDPPCRSSAEPCFQEDPGSDRLPSLPPSPDVDSQVCPHSPPTEEEEIDEDGPEMIASESSECDDGEPLAEGRINLEEQKDVPHSPTQFGSTDMDSCGANADEIGAEGEVLQDVAAAREVDQEVEEDAFPPPPSPVFFTEETNTLNEVEEDPQASCLPSSSQPSSPASSGPDEALGEDLQMEPQLPEHPSEPLEKTNVAPSRFAEAVALAVRKSRLKRQGRVLAPQASSRPHSDLPSTFYV